MGAYWFALASVAHLGQTPDIKHRIAVLIAQSGLVDDNKPLYLSFEPEVFHLVAPR